MGENETYMGAGKGCTERMPECDLATERALAEGRAWKNELEKAAIIANNDLQMKMAMLAQSMTTVNDAMKSLAETVKADHELVVESQRQWREMQEWRIFLWQILGRLPSITISLPLTIIPPIRRNARNSTLNIPFRPTSTSKPSTVSRRHRSNPRMVCSSQASSPSMD